MHVKNPRKSGYRIAHFGDLHLDAVDGEYHHALGMLDDAVQNGADHLVFTGDILDVAEAKVLESFVRELGARNLLKAESLTVVPGNHDIYPSRWPPTLDSIVRTIGMTAQSNFRRFARLTVKSRHGNASAPIFTNAPYPFAKVLSGDIVVAGLDTTRNNKRLPMYWAAGELCEEALDAVKVIFNEHRQAKHRIVVMHHYPFDDFKNVHPRFNMKFEEPVAATVRKWLKQSNATLALCGHIHDNRDRRDGGLRVICTDSVNTYENDDDDSEGRMYRMITLHGGGRVTATDRVVKEPKRKFR